MKPEAFHTAIREGDAHTVRRALAEDPALAREPTATGVGPVLAALYHGHADLAEEIASARSDALDLFEAAALGHVDTVREALARDAGATGARSADGFTALHLAAFFRRDAIVEALLAAGADPDAKAENAARVTPLHSAAAIGSEASVDALLAAGADPDARQAGGYTALHSAAAHGRLGLMRRLLRAGADATVTDDSGATPRDHAAKNDQHEAIALLEGAVS